MRRKIISQGNKSYTLTLPLGWITEQNLKAGDEVEIKEDENNIIIAPTKISSITTDSCAIDAKNLGKRAILRSLHNAYRKGYDKINVTDADSENFAYSAHNSSPQAPA